MELCDKGTVRIIPRLDVKGPNLVKGIHLEGLRVLGKPEDFATRYYEDGADELLYIDTVASLYGRQNLIDIVRRTAEDISIPLTAGGGVRSVDDIRELLRAGADKVAINTAAIGNPDLIREGARTFGSQCIVVSIAAQVRAEGVYEALTDNGREASGKNVLDWAREAAELGAGEILITSVDREGTGKGYDIGLVKSVSESVQIPVIACGGAGRAKDVLDVVRDGKADAVCLSSLLHYHRLASSRTADDYAAEGNIEFINKRRGGTDFMIGRIETLGIQNLKRYLAGSGVPCRV